MGRTRPLRATARRGWTPLRSAPRALPRRRPARGRPRRGGGGRHRRPPRARARVGRRAHPRVRPDASRRPGPHWWNWRSPGSRCGTTAIACRAARPDAGSDPRAGPITGTGLHRDAIHAAAGSSPSGALERVPSREKPGMDGAGARPAVGASTRSTVAEPRSPLALRRTIRKTSAAQTRTRGRTGSQSGRSLAIFSDSSRAMSSR